MKRYWIFSLFLVPFILGPMVTSCERRYNLKVSTAEAVVLDRFEIREFELDGCEYFAVSSWGSTTTAVEVEHKANCPNH